MNGTDKKKIVILLLLAIAIIVYITKFFLRKDDLIRNGINLNGRILSVELGSKYQIWFRYEFFYNGKVLKDESLIFVTNENMFVGKTFPVRFSPKTNRSELMITPRDFQRFKLTYPDSLQWVAKYIDKDKYKL